MSKETLRRRLALALVVVTLAVPVVGAQGASAQSIEGKRAEAAAVADRLEELEETAEVITEQYLDAQLLLTELDAKAEAAKAESARTQAELSARRSELAGYAVDAYVRGNDNTRGALILTSSDGNEIGQRLGYAEAALGDGEDVIDRMRGAKAAAESDITQLNTAKEEAEKAKVLVDAKYAEANAAVEAQAKVLDEVEGELAELVAAEQRRRAAEAARAAAAAAREFAAQQAALAASRPASQRPQTQAAEAEQGSDDSESGDDGEAGGIDPSTIAPPVGEGADAAIAAARSVLGIPYKWAGETPEAGFDCSGLVLWAWKHGGKSLPHSSRAMYGMSRRIPLEEMQPGDLVFYGSPVHHVALYIGGGQIIHAPRTGSHVQIASVHYWSKIAGAGRI